MKRLRMIAICCVASVAGCASNFHEHHYFRSVDSRGRPVNYYRVTIDGGVFLSTSRFLSGYFDETAVDTYFNEFSQPANGQFTGETNAGGQSGEQSSPGSQNVVPLDANLQNRKLVMILSSNSDEIATGISTLAQSNDVASTLTSIVSKDQKNQAKKAALAQKNSAAAAGALRTLGDSTVEPLTTASTKDEVNANLLTYANALASFLEPGTSFKSLDDAKAWVSQNAAHLEEKK